MNVNQENIKTDLDNNTFDLKLSSDSKTFGLMRANGNDFLFFSKELSDKVELVLKEHLKLNENEKITIKCTNFNAEDGISDLICKLSDSEIKLTLTALPIN